MSTPLERKVVVVKRKYYIPNRNPGEKTMRFQHCSFGSSKFRVTLTNVLSDLRNSGLFSKDPNHVLTVPTKICKVHYFASPPVIRTTY